MTRDELINYLEIDILNRYNSADEGHRTDHIKDVVKKCSQFSQIYNNKVHSSVTSHRVNYDVITTAAYFHDISLTIDHNKDKHEIKSAEIFTQDKVMNKYFTPEQMNTIKEAIEDHRTSLKGEPRSIYGKILSQADSSFNLRDIVYRCYLIRKGNQELMSDFSKLSLDIYSHIIEKYNPVDGYAYTKIWFDDPEVEEVKRTMLSLNTSERFEAFLKDVINSHSKSTFTTQDNSFTLKSIGF